MNIAMKSAPIVLIAVFLVGASCTRAPQDDQESPSDNSVSTPNNVSVASETDSHPGDGSWRVQEYDHDGI